MLTNRFILLLMAACIPVPVFAQAVVTSVSPARNANSASLSGNVTATYTANMFPPGSDDFRIYSPKRGWLAGATGASGNIISLDPNVDFLPGEELEVIATNQVRDYLTNPSLQHVWRFRTATPTTTPMFNSNTHQFQNVQGAEEWASVCADFDGDGDMDIAVGRFNGQSTVYFNDGNGGYSTSVNLGGAADLTYDLAIGDFDEDGDIDIVKSNYAGQNVVWLNDGSGNFTTSVNLGGAASETYCLVVGDLNGDGHLDIVCGNGNTSGVANTIHLGNGAAGFPVTKYIENVLGYGGAVADCTFDIELADMDNNGSLDIITAEFSVLGGMPCRVYYNDGYAGFSQSRFTGTALVANSTDLGTPLQAMAVAVGDIDNDGDNDVIIGTNGIPGTSTPVVGELTHMFFNNGNKTYNMNYMSGQDEKTWCIRLADFNGDGFLDCMFANEGGYRTVRLNNGTGDFLTWLYLGGSPFFYKCDVADMDGDGDLDVVSPRWIYHNGASAPGLRVKVAGNWLNDGDTIQLAHGTTLASLAPQILVFDGQNYYVTLSTNISNTTSQGFNMSEWAVSAGTTPYSMYPTAGVFNQGGVTHDFTLQADNAAGVTSYFVFHVQVDYAQVPVLEVTEGGAPVTHNGSASGGRDFGSIDVAAGATAPTVFTIENNGWVDLVVSSVSISGADALDFVLDLGGFNGTVTPAGSTGFALEFDPSAPGAKSATVEIEHNDPSLPSPFLFEVSGVGTAYSTIVVSEGATTLAQGAWLTWGPVAAGAAVSRTITIQNFGTGPLTLGTPALAGADAAQFSLDLSSFNATVATAGSTSFSVTYMPAAAGSHSGTLAFSHDAGTAASPFTLNLSGESPASGGDGGSAGSGGGSGGGCAGVGDSGLIWPMLLVALLVFRRRRQAQG